MKTKTIPWSDEGEVRLRLWRFLFAIVIVGGALTAVFGMVRPHAGYLLGGVCVAFAGGICEGLTRNRLQAMLGNKPFHGTQGLTRWHWHAPETIALTCPCGETHTFEGKMFHGNSLDPGGGRYSFVCPCGVGHYKFKGPLGYTKAS